ncbi:MAG: hypothetical protein ACREOZ_02735, partial [Gloeomargaritales cyanobacterium]
IPRCTSYSSSAPATPSMHRLVHDRTNGTVVYVCEIKQSPARQQIERNSLATTVFCSSDVLLLLSRRGNMKINPHSFILIFNT